MKKLMLKKKFSMAIIVFLEIIILGCYARSFVREISYIKSTQTYKRIKTAIDNMRIIDCHEHLWTEKCLLAQGIPDFFDLILKSYVGTDIEVMSNNFLTPANIWIRKFLSRKSGILFSPYLID